MAETRRRARGEDSIYYAMVCRSVRRAAGVDAWRPLRDVLDLRFAAIEHVEAVDRPSAVRCDAGRPVGHVCSCCGMVYPLLE